MGCGSGLCALLGREPPLKERRGQPGNMDRCDVTKKRGRGDSKGKKKINGENGMRRPDGAAGTGGEATTGRLGDGTRDGREGDGESMTGWERTTLGTEATTEIGTKNSEDAT